MKTMLRAALVAAFTLGASASMAGGQLDEIDITNAVPDANNQGLATLVGIRWDERAIPVRYKINNAQANVPNPLGAPVLTVAQARTALQASFDRWNRIATSYIDMRITGEVSNGGLIGFDFINELSFSTPESFGAIASSPSISLISDICLTDGEDINGDGTADVSGSITSVTEIGGQNVFPAGCYKAGTILDNDVQFNTKTSNGFRFTVNDADIDNNGRSVDLSTVATHEFGHSHGHSHLLTNNRGANNARGAIMFPSINTRDPQSELEQRALDSDDIANASRIYPEGTSRRGPAALQPGDFPFSAAYAKIRGKVTDGETGLPVAGANVFAINRLTGERVSSAYSGQARVLFDFTDGGLFLAEEADTFPNGDYELVVPFGIYTVGIEALDGGPVGAGQVSLTALISSLNGQQNFDRSFWNLRDKFSLSPVLGESIPVLAFPYFDTRNIDFKTERSIKAGNSDFRAGFGFTDVVPGGYYVVSVPVKPIVDNFPNGFDVQGVLFETRVVDSSTVPLFSEAMIVPGKVDAAGAIQSLDLSKPILRKQSFLATDSDFSPLYSLNPRGLGHRIQHGFERGDFDTLFLVLRLPEGATFPGPSALPPIVGIAFENNPGSFSYLSEDGGTTFTPIDFGFRFQLSVTPKP
jgi:hypothetical protein